MPYFPVDDELTYHPKVVAAGNAAIGVWARAGAWAKKYATGGFVSREVAHGLGARETKALVTSGLWKEGEHPKFGRGYWFHDWEHQAGNFDGDEEKARLEAKREADRDRQRRKRDRERESPASHGVTPPRVASLPSPSPSPKTDEANFPQSSHEIYARAIQTDEEFILGEAAKVGIRNMGRVHHALSSVVPGITVTSSIDVARSITMLATTRVRHPEKYIEDTCDRSPEVVEREYALLVNAGAVA